ncbi:MAG TPA: efflux RND transporter periplasmic adaptor subunit [Tepidisphaeraceae bacterium]|jgi:HlyD family secretion protein|nr:efflux RND transporter periplasmic adaptor subunit [Tepidisphaeraceae bacterium]
MESELHKLRIDKSDKARRDERLLWPWVVVGLVALLIGLAAFMYGVGGTAHRVDTIRVRVPEGLVTEADLVQLNATGYVTAAHKIELASKVVGRVAWVGVEMGDKVKKDQVLVRLEDDEYKARVAQAQGQLDSERAKLAELKNGSRPEEVLQAEAQVNEAKAELTNAQVNFRRLKELEGGRSVSQQQIDDAEALVRSRTARVESVQQAYGLVKAGPRQERIDAQAAIVRQLEGGLALAMVELNNTVIRSQIDATILGRNVEVGEFVTTGFVGDNGAKGFVVSLADLNNLRVELDVSQNDFAKVLPAQPCWIVTDAYPDRRYEGVVDLISPEANRQKATVQVRVKVLNPDELLKPDMNATVSFLSPRTLAATRAVATQPAGERPAIRVPKDAVRDNAVFLIEGGKAVRRTVTVGNTSASGEVEIRKGLIGGEDVVVRPPDTLKEGDDVRVNNGN